MKHLETVGIFFKITSPSIHSGCTKLEIYNSITKPPRIYVTNSILNGQSSIICIHIAFYLFASIVNQIIIEKR